MEIVYNSIHHFFLYTRRKMAISFLLKFCIFIYSFYCCIACPVLSYLFCVGSFLFFLLLFCQSGEFGGDECEKIKYNSHRISFMLLYFLYKLFFFLSLSLLICLIWQIDTINFCMFALFNKIVSTDRINWIDSVDVHVHNPRPTHIILILQINYFKD